MPRLSAAAASLLTILIATPALARDYLLGEVEVRQPYAMETPATATTGAAYLSVTNNGSATERLLAVRTPFPRAEIHAVETDAHGVTRMHAAAPLDIPAGATVNLAPGSLHIMLMGLPEPLAPGGRIPAILVFERAGELAVEFEIRPR